MTFASNVAPRKVPLRPKPRPWTCGCGERRPGYLAGCPDCGSRRPSEDYTLVTLPGDSVEYRALL